MNNRQSIVAVILFTLIFLLGACTPAVYVPLQMDKKQSLSSTDINVILEQHELYFEIKKSQIATFTGGGLIPALIDAAVNNARTETAEELAETVRAGLTDYNFEEEFHNDIKSQIASITGLNILELKFKDSAGSDSYLKYLKESNAASVIFVNSKYFLDPEIDDLKVVAYVAMIVNSSSDVVNKNNLKTPIYRNQFVFQENLGMGKITKEKAIETWAKDDCALAEAVLNTGADEITRMLIIDLNGYQPDEKKQVTINNVTGTLVDKNDKRSIIRTNKGFLFSIANSE